MYTIPHYQPWHIHFMLTQRLVYLSFCIALTVLCVGHLSAQNRDVVVSSPKSVSTAGRDFWLAFLPNMRITDESKNNDSLYIFISSDSSASGEVRYTLPNNSVVTRRFTIPDQRRVVSIGLPSSMELKGMLDDTTLLQNNSSEKVLSTNTVRITSSYPVHVSALNFATHSSDATIVYPNASLGRSYIPLAYKPSPWFERKDTTFVYVPQKSTTAGCAIIATEDSTIVQLELTSATQFGLSGNRTISLSKGQVYFFQSRINPNDSNRTDLSGSRIIANKKIAVFSGHQGSRLPDFPNDKFSYRDFRSTLFEQMIPVESWGTKFHLFSLDNPPGIMSSGFDRVIVTASMDSTKLYFGGSIFDTLNLGEVLELTHYGSARELTSSNPIFVAMYKESSTSQYDTTMKVSNASMRVIPPVELYSTSSRFVNYQIRQNGVRQYTEQYVAFVVPTNAVSTLIYDGSPISSQFTAIGNSGYSVTSRKISDGLHTASCEKPFMTYIYGYGPGMAYSTIGGAMLSKYPYLKAVVSADTVSAKIGDTVSISVRLDSLVLPPRIINYPLSELLFDVTFNATVLTPTKADDRGEIRDGLQYASFSVVPTSLKVGDTLANLSMICGLGDAEGSSVQINSLAWLSSASRDTVASLLTQQSGAVAIKDVWRDNQGARLINPNQGSINVSVSPNPIVTQAMAIITTRDTSKSAVMLKLYNSVGEEVLDITPTLVVQRNGTIEGYVERKMLPSGTYFIRASKGDRSVVRIVVLL
jgi:hypothetical protein